ncbi:MAG: ankyrin repeat domain-containing protein [bacterium]
MARNKGLYAMLVLGIMVLGINVAEGSQEGEDSPEKTQEKMTVAPVAKFSAKEVEKARFIVKSCLDQLFRPGGINKRGEAVDVTFPEKVHRENLSEKMDIPFVYTFQHEKKCIVLHTTLNEQSSLIIECFKALKNLKLQSRFWPENAEDLMCLALVYGNPIILRTSLKMGCSPNKLSIPKKIRMLLIPNKIRVYDKPLRTVLEDFPGKKELVRILVEHGADVNNDVDKPQYLSLATKNRDVESVRILLDHGANPNLKGSISMPLILAVYFNHTDIALLLLEHGANPNVGIRPPIFNAVLYNNVEILEKLIEAGANIEACNEYGIKPVEASAFLSREKAMKCLLDHGANIFSAWCCCLLGSEELDMRMKEIKQAFSIPLDPTKAGEREQIIENLRKVRKVKDREMCLFDLIGVEHIDMSPFPCDLITDRLITHLCHTWYVIRMGGEGVHLLKEDTFSFADIEELKKFHDAIADKIEELDEEHKQQFESVFERTAKEIEESEVSISSSDEDFEDSIEEIEDEETSEASTTSVNEDSEDSTEDAEDKNEKQETFGEGEDGFEVIRRAPQPYVNIAMEVVTQPGPERRGPRSQGVSKHASKSSSDREAVVEDSAKEEKKVKEFNTPMDIIFRLNPESHSKELEGKKYSEATRFIQELCFLLTEAGLKCKYDVKKSHYKLGVDEFPAWAKDLKAYKLPDIMASSHGANKPYTKFFNEIISYLFHGLCLLAQSKNPKATEALEFLKKYAREGKLDVRGVLGRYGALIPHFL